MLTSLLPGIRELRTPLASGYLWLLNAWVIFGEYVPRHQPTAGPIAGLWDLFSYAGKGALFAATTFIAYLVGSFLEVNPQRMWEYGGRPEWLSRLRDLLRRGDVLSRLRVIPFSVQAERDLVAFSKEDLGVIVEGQAAATDMMKRVMYEERQLATRLQAQNFDLFGRYDRLLSESSFRLNIAPPLVLLLILIVWLSPLTLIASLMLTALCLGYGALLFSQAVARAVQSRDVIAQALVVGVLESKSLSRLQPQTAESESEIGPTVRQPSQRKALG